MKINRNKTYHFDIAVIPNRYTALSRDVSSSNGKLVGHKASKKTVFLTIFKYILLR